MSLRVTCACGNNSVRQFGSLTNRQRLLRTSASRFPDLGLRQHTLSTLSARRAGCARFTESVHMLSTLHLPAAVRVPAHECECTFRCLARSYSVQRRQKRSVRRQLSRSRLCRFAIRESRRYFPGAARAALALPHYRLTALAARNLSTQRSLRGEAAQVLPSEAVTYDRGRASSAQSPRSGNPQRERCR